MTEYPTVLLSMQSYRIDARFFAFYCCRNIASLTVPVYNTNSGGGTVRIRRYLLSIYSKKVSVIAVLLLF